MILRRVTTLASLGIVGVLLWGFWMEPASLQVQEIDLPLEWRAAAPLRVAVLSDLHVGSPYHGLRGLRATVDRTNAARPDLICLLGDLVTRGVVGGTFVPPERFAPELGRLRAPAGVVAVLGNHDRSLDGPRVAQALVGVGIKVLEDTAIRIARPSGPVWVVGVSDYWTGAHDIPRALSRVTDSVGPIILMTHNPDIFPQVPEQVAITLAGHTHGGQVRLPLLGAPIVPSRYGQRFAAGSVIEGKRHLFVSTGIGTSFVPVRLGVPPTVFVLTLHQAKS
jgi:uncharacterized protein